MSARGSLPLPNCLDELEAVQLGHVDVQEQQVERPLFRQGQRLPTVVYQPRTVAASYEQLLEKLPIEFRLTDLEALNV
jgi:hypothetical protein